MSSAACCAGSCGCGSGCKCQTSCGGCKMNPVISASETTASNTTTIAGLAPTKSCNKGSEMGAENGGCKCGEKCTCDPCTCK